MAQGFLQKVIALFLFSALVTGRTAITPLASAMPAPHSAGCHGETMPQHSHPPLPADTRCCAAGHEVALASAVFSFHPAWILINSANFVDASWNLALSKNPRALDITSSSPPDLSPLRI
jgi:hypothetical protein